MSPAALEALAPVLALAVGGIVLSIPLLAFGIRFAAKPLIEALVRYREIQGRSQVTDETVLLHDRRLSLVEAELQHLSAGMRQLAEADEFRRQLNAPAAEVPGEATAGRGRFDAR